MTRIGTKKNQWNHYKYYVIIIILCVMMAIFIWYLFRVTLAKLEKENQDGALKKQTVSAINRIDIQETFFWFNYQ